MPHDVDLISTVTVSFALAFVLGFLAHFVRLQPLVGYLLAGVVIGNYIPGSDADTAIAWQLAESGEVTAVARPGDGSGSDDTE